MHVNQNILFQPHLAFALFVSANEALLPTFISFFYSSEEELIVQYSNFNHAFDFRLFVVTYFEQLCKMSEGIEALQLKEDDVTKFLAAGAHLGAQNVDRHMESYVYKRKGDGIHIINLRKTWEKLVLAARVIAGIENPADVCVLSSRPYGTVSHPFNNLFHVFRHCERKYQLTE